MGRAIPGIRMIFQFTPLREGRQRGLDIIDQRGYKFQFTPLREGRHGTANARLKAQAIFQFTPLREGRHEGQAGGCTEICISIHAPAGGATCGLRRSQHNALISIHAPAGGATKVTKRKLFKNLFQFTPLREGRLFPLGLVTVNLGFQFTPLREGRPGSLPMYSPCLIFQFTPLREGRRSARNGRDQLRLISIHAPAGGATPRLFSSFPALDYFNSRPCGRGDIPRPPSDKLYKYFNSRPCGRGD